MSLARAANEWWNSRTGGKGCVSALQVSPCGFGALLAVAGTEDFADDADLQGLPPERADCFLARWDGKPAGFAVLDLAGSGQADPVEPVLRNLFVVPARRGLGIGTALVAAVERSAHARGYRNLRLDVDVDNPAAARLYSRLGFEYTGQGRNYSWTFTPESGPPRQAHENARAMLKKLT